MENKYQKTIGKFYTKTKTVSEYGNKANLDDILFRSFCRILPLDRISFLFMDNGIHDYFSKTRVIRDNKTNTNKV